MFKVTPIKIRNHEASELNSLMDKLFDLFPDHDVRFISADEMFQYFELALWAREIHIDNGAIEVAKTLFGLELEEIGYYHKLDYCGDITFITTMLHSRAILAPLHSMISMNLPPIRCIIHVDDHTDLMPLLLKLDENNLFCDSFFGESVDFSSPISVLDAIERGIIHKGNFLTAYVASNIQGTIHHIRPATENALKTQQILEIQNWHENLKSESFPTIATSFLPLLPPVNEAKWVYQESTQLPTVLSIPAHDFIWLDIDLDAFCNRYDGDSNNSELKGSEREQEIFQLRLLEFLQALKSSKWITQVKAVSVSVSPGFFPSEYWQYTLDLVNTKLRSLLC